MPHIQKSFNQPLGLAVSLGTLDSGKFLSDPLRSTQGGKRMVRRAFIFRAIV